MADEKQAVEAIDINSPDLQVEELNVDTEKDQFASLPVIPDGTYDVKVTQKKPDTGVDSLWVRAYGKKTKKPYLKTALELRVIDPGGKFDNWPIFDNFVSTMVQEMTGTNKIVGILKALGVAANEIPRNDAELARKLTDMLAGEPQLKVTTQWEGYCETDDKTKVKGEKRYPKLKNGEGHDPAMECPTCGTALRTNAAVVKYLPA